MATAARRASENRQTEGCSNASDNPVAEAVRISQPHHRARAGRCDRLVELRQQKHVRDGHYTLRNASEPRVFSQVNDEVAQALRDLIVDLVPPNQDLLIDAYCGAGFFAKALLDRFERVIGIDWDRFAIAAAKQNASEKETYIAGDVESELTRSDGFLAVEGETRRLGSRRSLTIIVDPPATGLTEGRDLKELQHRFAINSITPLDMFPQTAEIEVVAHLEAQK